MNQMTGCQHIRQSLGVYVLGAIDPAERAQVDAHLAGCPGCREELAGLAGLPALLGRVPAEEAARIAGFDSERLAPGQPPGPGPDIAGDTLTPLLDRVAHRRRVNRWRGLAAAAAVALIAAGAGIGVAHASHSSLPAAAAHWESVHATDAATHASVVVRYAPMPWGTSLDTEVSGIPAGTTCEFWVVGANGAKWPAGGWTVAGAYQGTWYPGSAAVPAAAVHGFEITSGGKVLVHVAAS